MSQDLHVINLTKSDLRVQLKNNSLWGNTYIIPFSKSKAYWILNNTRVDENDLCAVMAYEGKQIVALVFLIPDIVQVNEERKKIYWCRRWWVAEKHLNSVLSTYVMNEAIKATGNQIFFKFLGKNVEPYFKKQPFIEYAKRTRYFIIFNLDSGLIIGKLGFLKYFKPLLNIIDKISYKLIISLNKKKYKSIVNNLKYEYISKIDEATWSFLAPKLQNDLVYKTREYLNWQLSNDQNTQILINNKSNVNDLIASTVSNIYHTNFTVICDHKIVGFISALIRVNEFYVKYFVYEDAYYDHCLCALMENFNNTSTNTIYTENDKLGKSISERFTSVYSDKRKLYSLAHKDIDFDLTNVKIQDQDANFT